MQHEVLHESEQRCLDLSRCGRMREVEIWCCASRREYSLNTAVAVSSPMTRNATAVPDY